MQNDYCKNCGKMFLKRDFRHMFCSVSCRYEYYSNEKRKQKIEKLSNAKEREFSDMTLTLVASAIIRGQNLDIIVKLCNWDRNRFYDELEKNSMRVQKRIKLIEKNVLNNFNYNIKKVNDL